MRAQSSNVISMTYNGMVTNLHIKVTPSTSISYKLVQHAKKCRFEA
jgi:hypothetical protein